MGLTEKQQRFVDYYIELGNATEAYIKAGYNIKGARANAARLITKDSIRTYIDQRLEEIASNRIAKAEEVLEYLTFAMRGEVQEEVVVVEGSGEGCSEATTVKKQISARDRIKAAELLGKRYRLFTDKIENEEVPLQITFVKAGEVND